MDTVERVWEALKGVNDPELPVSIVDLGLIEAVSVDNGTVHIRFTVTSLGCGCVDWIQDDVRQAVTAIPGVKAVEVELVWDRVWRPERMTARARERFESWGIRT